MSDSISETKLANHKQFLIDSKIEHAENYDMSNYSSWKVGPITRIISYPKNLVELKIIIENLIKAEINYIIAGNATNTLYIELKKTIIISTKKLKNIVFSDYKDTSIEIVADCGCPLSLVLNKSLKKGLVGFEFSNGIPGTIGGALITNAGANGGTISDSLVSVFFLRGGKEVEVKKEKIEFGYRYSSIKREDVITRAKFILEKGDIAKTQEKIKEFIKHRNETQPVQFPSAGSVFMNNKNIAAGKLIQDLGLKGLTVGGAQVSELHANYIINLGGANPNDILDLIEKIKSKSKEKLGITLETEVRIIDE